MMKTYSNKLFLCFLILATLFTSVSAQRDNDDDRDPPPPPPDPFTIVKDSGGSGGAGGPCTHDVTFYVTNLDDYGITEVDGKFTITNQVPAIKLQLIIDGNSMVFDANTFTHFGTYTEANGDVNSVYVFSQMIPSSMIPLCGENQNQTYPTELRVLTPGTSSGNTPGGTHPLPAGMIYYPIANYAQPATGLFSCQIFGFTACICTESCTVVPASFFTDTECRTSCSSQTVDWGYASNPNNQDQMASPKNLKVSPNPFQSSFVLDYTTEKEENIGITLFNSNGQKAAQWQESVYTGANTISLDVEDLPTGIYFLQVSNSAQESSFIKVLKN